jgi:hypothetical protein
MRIYGIRVSDINCRLLIAQLLAEEITPALNLAERLSEALARNETAAPLVPGERDLLLRNIPKHPPSRLMELRDALRKDKSAATRRLTSPSLPLLGARPTSPPP